MISTLKYTEFTRREGHFVLIPVPGMVKVFKYYWSGISIKKI